MKLIIKNDYNAMSTWAAEHIANAINNHKENRPFVLGLPTGSSPLGVYKKCMITSLITLIFQKKTLIF